MKLFRIQVLIITFLALGCKSTKVPTVELKNISALNPDKTVNVIIEIPTGTTAKYELNKKTYTLKIDSIDGQPRHIEYLGYPGNYGMIPKTISPKQLGGDGDPLDVLVLGPSEKKGSVHKVRVIGVLELLDNGEQDDKLIAVLPESHWGKIQTIEELDRHYPGCKTIIATFFENYKGKGQMKLIRWSGKSKAMQILHNSLN